MSRMEPLSGMRMSVELTDSGRLRSGYTRTVEVCYSLGGDVRLERPDGTPLEGRELDTARQYIRGRDHRFP
ncbi:MAG: hypothetical protein HYT73_03505 [Candidatus Aenigmarchaeota archaeon]|nr:hypothetical protein [Candidatus Aenigmarchaeota archaeon]